MCVHVTLSVMENNRKIDDRKIHQFICTKKKTKKLPNDINDHFRSKIEINFQGSLETIGYLIEKKG